MEEIVLKIQEMVDWYQLNSSTASIECLLRLKDKLVVYNYNLAEILSDMSKNYHKYYYIRKMTISRRKNAMIKDGTAVNKAESIATEQAAQDFDNELEAEALANKLDLKLKQSNKIVEAITQRISVLKMEFKESK